MDHGLLFGAITYVLLMPWFLQANRKWSGLLAEDDPRLAYDPVREPVTWIRGGGYRVTRWLSQLFVHDARSAVELWRVRTINRFIVWVGVTTFAFLAVTPIVELITTFIRLSVERYSSGFGILSVAVFGFMLALYAARLGRAFVAFGNGQRVTAIELAVASGGIVAVLVGMAIWPNLDLSKPPR